MNNRKKSVKIKKFISENRKNLLTLAVALCILLLAVKGGLHLIDRISVKEVLKDNSPYTVYGVDVSNYQGDVDWKVLKDQDISFAFIKATEGGNFTDKRFKYNWRHSKWAHVKRGAYHFFSFDSDPVEQAENFMRTVPKDSKMLPPVVDFETYGKYENAPPPKEELVPKLAEYIGAIEEHYNMTPVIYCNTYCYNRYIQGSFDNPVWLANPSAPPTLPDGNNWEFLQYSFYGILDGYENGVKHIDLNVYRGTREEFLDTYF